MIAKLVMLTGNWEVKVINRKKTIIIFQSLIIVALISGIVLLVKNTDKAKANPNESIIFHFNQGDLDRIANMVNRFNKGQGDNLMIITPTIDSGPIIHDVHSDGREISWSIDNSRDAWNTNSKKTVYTCGAIRIHDRDSQSIDVQLSKCKNYKADEQLNILRFEKDKL